MEAQSKSVQRKTAKTTLWLMVLMSLAAVPAIYAAEEPEPRINATKQGKESLRRAGGTGVAKVETLDPLSTTGGRDKTRRSTTQQKVVGGRSSAPDVDFWFFGADVELFSDFDGDGYYYGIDLAFDADTVFLSADVYAVIYLSHELGPWNEVVETDVFNISGATGDDEYFIETELLSGYPTGSYDILIELFDTFDGAFVASIGPEETSELAFLPLEDANRDAVETIVVVESGGGGSFTWLSLLVLAGFGARAGARRHFPES